MIRSLAQLAPVFINGGLAVAGAAAVAIPIAIHLLWRRRRQPQPWAAMRFLIEAYRKHRSRMRLEQFLLLAIRCLILITLGLALSGPLLGGFAAKLGSAFDSTTGSTAGRLICLVIDDSLSTQADTQNSGASSPSPEQRFEQLRSQALAVLDASSAGDRIAIWSVARPARSLLAATNDHTQAKKILRDLSPRFSRSDLLSSMNSVSELVTQEALPAARVFVVVLSDFAQGSLPVDRSPLTPPPAAWTTTAQASRFLLNHPPNSLPNTQITSLVPRRQMIFIDDASRGPGISVELRMKRFAPAELSAATSKIELTLLDLETKNPCWTGQKNVAWSAGQSESVTQWDVDLSSTPAPLAQASWSAFAGAGGRMLGLKAQLNHDALDADNTRLAVLELRQRLVVGMVDGPAIVPNSSTNNANANAPDLDPHRWLSLALAPMDLNANAGMELMDASVTALDATTAHAWDAAMVLRPDLLTETGWLALRELAERGGVVWIFPPPLLEPAIWGNALRERLGLDWELTIDPISSSNNASSNTLLDDAVTPVAATPWSLASETPTPELLNLLSADWADLLHPVRVTRRLGLRFHDSQNNAWLTLSDTAHSPLLAVERVGDGHVVFLATALETSWTNLMAKPLFVPLLHEGLRSLLGHGAGQALRNGAIAGQPQLLDRAWQGVPRADRWLPEKSANLPGKTAGEAISLTRSATEASTLVAHEPGIVRAVPAQGRAWLAVNVDDVGGNTISASESQLTNWLGPVKNWQWLDVKNPFKQTQLQTPRSNWGWPLLLISLILIVIEMFLARWFSHATLGNFSDPIKNPATGIRA